ncbi:hypothetical protein NBRC116601_33580 [Cognatishimia sp. WU-CL00825]|uniref:calcium-binding protein n=1 Tax=Cognatishimia sp. WU-CL00825 TaxID=3127658 RepID=UPI0031059450
MVHLTHRATQLGAPLDAVLTIDDLDILETDAGHVLLATSRATGEVTSYLLGPGSTDFLGSSFISEILNGLGPVGVHSLTVGTDVLICSTVASGNVLPSYQLVDGRLTSSGVALSGAHLDTSLTAMTSLTLEGQTYVFTANLGGPGVGRYQLASSGVMTNTRAPDLGMADGGDDISSLLTVTLGAQPFLVTASATGHHLSCYQVGAAGGLLYRGSLGAEQGLGIAAPQALAAVAVGGVHYLLVAASGSSSLSVLRLGTDGSLTPVDHLVDDQFSRFQGVSVLETIEVDGRVFVMTGGTDGGLTLFQLLPQGQLLMLDVQEDLSNLSLAQVSALQLHYDGTQLQVFAGSANEAGVSHFTVTLPSVGLERTAGLDAALSGGAGSDILYDAAGDEQLYGWGGDDILIGGMGRDRFEGGDGRDIFILSGDGQDDRIVDFEAGLDLIDLTGWSGLYGRSLLQFFSTAGGGRIEFGDERLIVRTADGASLSVAQLSAAVMQNFTRTDLQFGAQDFLIEGTAQNDLLQGSAADDILRGLAGADTLRGGAGSDTVSYEDSRGSLRVDLLFAHINTNVAAGDTYFSIENIIGSQGFDNLRGTFGDNYIAGGRNVDYIFGRRGDDILEGGIGDDVLFGGVGRDTLIGGSHRDRAQYSESLTAIVADLAMPRFNTGEAAGDSYSSIEDLAGGAYGDSLFGDREANRLFGREGADRLFGRQGNDYLNGGAHQDRLDGGPGNDVLRGGTHADTFVFNAGHDRIEDFRFAHGDRVALDRDMLGIGARDGLAVIDDFGRVENGRVILDFGSDSLTFDGLASMSGLAEVLIFL